MERIAGVILNNIFKLESVNKRTLQKNLFLAIILSVLFVTLVVPKNVLASTVQEFGFENTSAVPEACQSYLSGNDIKNDIEFSACLASAGTPIKSPQSEKTPAAMIMNVISWIMRVIGALAVAFIVYGGITYITSGGDEKRVAQAKNILLYAIIGFVITILAQVILWIVTSAIG